MTSLPRISGLTIPQLVELHSMSSQWYDLRRRKKMETCTRVLQWRIVNELLKRDKESPLAQQLLLAECLEADNYAHCLNLPYRIGDRLEPFTPSDYSDDESLVKHIRALAQKRTYLSREALIDIADYIQTQIVETGTTAQHLPVVSAILSTGMPSFSYPEITRALEKTTSQLAKSNSRTRMELAPAYHSLWIMTLKPSYLRKFENTVRHCYRTLADDKTYPGLGVDPQDPRSLSAAISFLDDNRQTLWILNDRYDLDKVIRKYRPRFPDIPCTGQQSL